MPPAVGLTLLVDFDASEATIPQASIEAYCNGDNYTGYGNNGSVKQYFYDNSNGRLIYSNVVTVYVRIPNSLHPKSYYNDTTKSAGGQGNLLIRDALNILKALPNYATEILPQFEGLTVDGNNRVVALNVFYAGSNGGVWSQGLWSHSSSLYAVGQQELSPGGKKVYRYQITNIGSSLALGTFCHENGHMLCGFPDIYDYEYDSAGGAGRFCLMNSGGSGSNPAQVSAYLKRAAGWATTTELTSSSLLTAVLTAPMGTNFNHFYRYAKPGVATEYYLLENRQRAGRDSGLPAAGIAIWHIDERGDRDNQSLVTNTVHANYECTLVQADNEWHFQRDINGGDSRDLWYQGNSASAYVNRFTDHTAPAAQWWDGTPSGLTLRNFSASGPTMTVSVEGPGGTAPPLITIQPRSQIVAAGKDILLSVTADGTEPLACQWRKDDLDLLDGTNRLYTLLDSVTNDSGNFRVVVSNPYGAATSTVANLTVYLDTTPPEVPAGLVLLPVSCRQINLRWPPAADAGGAGTEGYRVFRDGLELGTTAQTSFVDTNVVATFSEPLEPNSAAATPATTYTLAPLTGGSSVAVLSATLSIATQVWLTTAPRAPGINYRLTAANVTDASAQLNVVAPNPAQAIVASEIALLQANGSYGWKFSEAGALQAGWFMPAFGAAGWSNGLAVLSQNAGEGGLPPGFVNRTALRAPNAGGPLTVYFRAQFDLPGPPDKVRLQLSYVIDDGAVFYLNGQEVHRARLPEGAVDENTPAATATEPHPLEGPVTLFPTNLVERANFLAVEVHQTSGTSSDVVMAAELTGLLPLFTEPPPPAIGLQINRFGLMVMSWSDFSYRLQKAESLAGPWVDIQTTSPAYTANPRIGAGGFFRLKR